MSWRYLCGLRARRPRYTTIHAGALVEDRYNRLDDGSHLNQAHLRKAWRREWRAEEGVSKLMPYEGGIYQVMDLSSRPVVSVHLYGPAGAIDGRDYDPMRDYVCDRVISNDILRFSEGAITI